MLKTLTCLVLIGMFGTPALSQIHVGHTRTPHSGSPYMSTDAHHTSDSPFELSLGSRFERSVLSFKTNESNDIKAIEHRLISSLSVRFPVIDKLDFLAQAQFLSTQQGMGLSRVSPLAQDPTFGRTRIALRWSNFVPDVNLTWSIQPGVSTPSADNDPLFGGPDFVPSFAVLFSQHLSPLLHWASSIQYEHRSDRQVGPLVDAPTVGIDLGVALNVRPSFALMSEVHLHRMLASDPYHSASLDVGSRIEVLNSLALKLGYSIGFMDGPGTPESSIFFGLDVFPSSGASSETRKHVSPPQPRKETRPKADKTKPKPPGAVQHRNVNVDSDQDSVLDQQDQCPLLPEDRDEHEDLDGCPDYDNDHDGHLDHLDKDPGHPEDYDGYEDHDGIPEPDNDGDGLSDGQDACPDHAGVGDGCPESTFDWRSHVDRAPSTKPLISFSESAVFVDLDSSGTESIDFLDADTEYLIADVAEWIQNRHDWARMNVMGSYCYSNTSNAGEELALKTASKLTKALIDLEVSSNRIGYLSVGRYPVSGDDCEVRVFIKRLRNFEGIGNQVGDQTVPVQKQSPSSADAPSELLAVRFVPHQDSPTIDTAPVLIEFAQRVRLKALPFKILIHTDSFGDPDKKLALSARRANRLSELLVQLGVSRRLFEVKGMGSSSPIADNSTRLGRKQNNRVEVKYSGTAEQKP